MDTFWLLHREERTHEGTFNLLDGSQVSVPMMEQIAGFGYAEGYQAVELLYVGREFSMVVLLPEAGWFEEFESALDTERVAAILGDIVRRNVHLTMPKFTYESEFRLKDALVELGMVDAFSDWADFLGITSVERLKIDAVVHKAFVAVDEAGTEAAAATAVVIVPPALPLEVRLDRPFLFMIRDIETGAILFLGRAVNPVA